MSLPTNVLIITDLCDDVLCKVIDFLPFNQVLAIQLVNKDFRRCARKCLQSVELLYVRLNYFSLYKLNKHFKNQPYYVHQRVYKSNNKSIFFSSIDTIFSVITSIKRIEISEIRCFDDNHMVDLINRCPNICFIKFEINDKIRFSDNNWNRFAELIKHCDIKLYVKHNSSSLELAASTIASRLERLFTIATKIVSVSFKTYDQQILSTIDLLEESVFIQFDYVDLFKFEPGNQEIGKFLANRFNNMFIDLKKLLELRVDCYEKMSELVITTEQTYWIDPTLVRVIQFPRLKHLSVTDENSKFVSNLIPTYLRMIQLERLVITTNNFTKNSFKLLKILSKNLKSFWLEINFFHINQLSFIDELLLFIKTATLNQLRVFHLDLKILTIISADDVEKYLAEPFNRFELDRPFILRCQLDMLEAHFDNDYYKSFGESLLKKLILLKNIEWTRTNSISRIIDLERKTN